jgi:CBS domain-containing protein
MQDEEAEIQGGALMRVHEIMHEFPVCCTQWDTALEAARTMKENDVGVLPVVAKNGAGRLVGIVTDRDLCLAVVPNSDSPIRVNVASCMTTPAISCRLDDDVMFAMSLMRQHHVRRIPVIDSEGSIAGMLSITNLVNNVDPNELLKTLKAVFRPSPRNMQAHRAPVIAHSA